MMQRSNGINAGFTGHASSLLPPSKQVNEVTTSPCFLALKLFPVPLAPKQVHSRVPTVHHVMESTRIIYS
jgi:hypothetical protein